MIASSLSRAAFPLIHLNTLLGEHDSAKNDGSSSVIGGDGLRELAAYMSTLNIYGLTRNPSQLTSAPEAQVAMAGGFVMLLMRTIAPTMTKTHPQTV